MTTQALEFLSILIGIGSAVICVSCAIAIRRGRADLEVAASEMARLRSLARQHVSDR